MKPVKSTEINYLYKIFKPQLSPKKMLELGVFGGSYFEGKIKEYPKSWFVKAKLSKTFDIKQNYFKVKAGLSREYWIEKGWIHKVQVPFQVPFPFPFPYNPKHKHNAAQEGERCRSDTHDTGTEKSGFKGQERSPSRLLLRRRFGKTPRRNPKQRVIDRCLGRHPDRCPGLHPDRCQGREKQNGVGTLQVQCIKLCAFIIVSPVGP